MAAAKGSSNASRPWIVCLAQFACVLVATLGATGVQEPIPPARVAVSPSKFEIEIGAKPTTQALRLFNLGDERVEVQVTVATWELDEANRVQVVEPTEQSLDQWIVINPLRFEIPAHESQTVRFPSALG